MRNNVQWRRWPMALLRRRSWFARMTDQVDLDDWLLVAKCIWRILRKIGCGCQDSALKFRFC